MAQVNSNSENRFSGEYMVQDNDHMGSSSDKSQGAKSSKRQRTQGQQQQDSESGSRQQGGERRSRR